MPSENSGIGWNDSSWNPIHGCFKVSEGCANCYAARMSYEDQGWTDYPWLAQHAEENVQTKPHHLDFPDSLDEPQRIFVNSMSDLFAPEDLVPDEFLHDVFDVIERNPEHAFIALTKHGAETGEMHGETPRLLRWDREYGRWPENLWMGVSVENARRSYRADVLRETGARTKWISFEPLIGGVDPSLEGIDWVVIGGESHDDPKERREMDHAWARRIVSNAIEADVPAFFKQSSAGRPETGTELALYGVDAEAADQLAPDDRPATVSVRQFPELPEALRERRGDLAAQEVRDVAE